MSKFTSVKDNKYTVEQQLNKSKESCQDETLNKIYSVDI